MITLFPLITQNKTKFLLFLKVFCDIHKYRYIYYTFLTISVIEKLTYVFLQLSKIILVIFLNIASLIFLLVSSFET